MIIINRDNTAGVLLATMTEGILNVRVLDRANKDREILRFYFSAKETTDIVAKLIEEEDV